MVQMELCVRLVAWNLWPSPQDIPFSFSSTDGLPWRLACRPRHKKEIASNNTHAANLKGVKIGLVEKNSMFAGFCTILELEF
jgi:hypothetical protein